MSLLDFLGDFISFQNHAHKKEQYILTKTILNSCLPKLHIRWINLCQLGISSHIKSWSTAKKRQIQRSVSDIKKFYYNTLLCISTCKLLYYMYIVYITNAY